jgi:osmotically-inducible protein OsmY
MQRIHHLKMSLQMLATPKQAFRQASDNPSRHPHTAVTPMDLTLRQRIARLLSDIRPELPEQVTVQVLNHEVYVSGSVNLASEAQEIIQQIQALPAVREVHHLLTVRCRCRICSLLRR